MVVVILAEDGFEDSELLVPMERIREAGYETVLAGREAGRQVEGKQGAQVTTDVAVGQVAVRDVDCLVIPGGQGPDKMRLHGPFVTLARDCMEQGVPVAAICHGPQLLIEAGVVDGRRMTSWPSVRTDLENAGATVVDEQVVEDDNLITSRMPDDNEAFASAILDRLSTAPRISPGTSQN